MLGGIFVEPSRVTLFNIACLTSLRSLHSVESLMISECGNVVAGNGFGLIWVSGETEETHANIRMRSPTTGGDVNERRLQFAVRPSATSSYVLVVASFRGRAVCLLPIRGHTRRHVTSRHVTSRHVTTQHPAAAQSAHHSRCTARDTHQVPICCLLSVHSLANVPSNIHL